MELKKKQLEVVYQVEYGDLDDFVNHHYPNLKRKFNFVADEEMGNDSQKKIEVDGELDEWEERDIKDGRVGYMTVTLLNDLCKRGIIPKGTYIINVCW